MPYFDIILAGLTAKDNKFVATGNIDAMPARGDAIQYNGTLYRVMDIVHRLNRNVTELIVLEDRRVSLGETLKHQEDRGKAR